MASWVTPADLAAGAAAGPLLGPDGSVSEPLLLVDLDAGAAAGAADAAAESDRVLVGVTSGRGPADLVEALDVTLTPVVPGSRAPGSRAPGSRVTVGVRDPGAEADTLRVAALANPAATVVLAGLLRWSGSLAVPAALDAESLAYSTLLGGPEFRRWLERRGPRPLPPPAATDPVLVSRAGDVLGLELNRPERRNAFGREVRDALVAGLEVAEVDGSISRVVLTGAGPAFCAGGDLDEFGTTPDLATAHLVRTRAGAGRLLHRLAPRVEARLHGPCVGAGIELPAFAGRVVADPGATFRLPEIGMGLIPGAGGTVSIPRRIGRWRTLYLALAGAPLDAATALQWGLADAVERR
ncbi:MAG: enoyl-CoA hydratase/isomerase family protein [Pseudonocardia sp.]|nr:enoyl-CoA hydratase/isomerase family protein [Pseudonocardia sp.]